MNRVMHAPGRFKSILRWTGSVLRLVQPFLALLVFLSVLAGTPPLWISWLVALFPSIFRLSRKERLLLRTPFDIPIIILTAGMLLGYFLSPVRELAGTALNTYLAGLVFYYSLVGNSKAKTGYWLTMAAFFMLVSLSLAVIIFSSGGGRQVSFNIWIYSLGSKLHFFSQTGMYSNVLGVIFAIWLPVLLAIAIFSQKTRVRWVAAITAVLCGVLLVLSASGGGWIAAVIGILFVLLARGFKTLLGAVAAVVTIAGITSPFWYGAKWIGTVLPYQDLGGRVDMWRATAITLKEHPITGLGLSAWWSTVHTWISPGGPHSTYVQLYSDCGILGLIALGAVVYTGVIVCRKNLHARGDNHNYGLFIGIVAGCIVAVALAFIENIFVVLTPIGDKNVCFTLPLVGLLLALLVISSRHFLKEDYK